MKLLFNYLPIFLFFLAYKFYGIYVATGIAIACSLLQVAVYWIQHRRFEKMYLITFFLILILGGATLLLHKEIFIKWKPTILYWLFAVLLFSSSFFGSKPLIQRFMEGYVQLPTLIWRRLNIGWSLFFLFLGCVNLFVVYHCTTNTWVNFKLFGTSGLILLFLVVQTIYTAKYIELKAENK